MPRSRTPASRHRPVVDPDLREPRYSQSLERGLAILGCFSSKRPVLGIADIADDLGMSRSTTHRYVITLVALGYLEQGASRKYRLGLRVTDLGMSALELDRVARARPPRLEELRQRTSYTAEPRRARRRGDRLRRPRPQLPSRTGQDRPRPAPGSRLPAYCTVDRQAAARLPARARAARADRQR